jgi:MscS family membrane protein
MTFEQIPDFLRDAAARGALIIAALAVLWLVRYVVIWLLTRPLVHLAERVGMPLLDDKLRDVVTTPVQFAFFGLAVLIIGTGLVLDEFGALFFSRLARTLFILAIAVALYKALQIVAFSRGRLFALTGVNMDEALLPFVRVGLEFLVIAFAVVIVVQEWGYDVSALVAGLGLGGLAFSLAASDTIANLFGFSMIVGDRPFVVGDTIKTTDVEGVVERVGLRSTRIRQPDQALVTVPNKTLANSVILNWSRLGKRYINFTLRLSSDASVAHVQRVVNDVREMLEIRPRVEADSISVRFTGFGDAWLEVLVRCYVLIVPWDEFALEREAINLEIMKILTAAFADSDGSAQVVITDEAPPLPIDPAGSSI